jgi:hypothetical protein
VSVPREGFLVPVVAQAKLTDEYDILLVESFRIGRKVPRKQIVLAELHVGNVSDPGYFGGILGHRAGRPQFLNLVFAAKVPIDTLLCVLVVKVHLVPPNRCGDCVRLRCRLVIAIVGRDRGFLLAVGIDEFFGFVSESGIVYR